MIGLGPVVIGPGANVCGGLVKVVEVADTDECILGVVVMWAGGDTDVPMICDPESKRVRLGF